MIYEYNKFSTDLFKDLNDYKEYYLLNQIGKVLGVDLNSSNIDFNKNIPSAYDFLNKYGKIELQPELDDLCRLHYLVRKRKVTTILEFGVGKSTIIFNDAIEKNEIEFGSKIKESNIIRRSNNFECHTIDDQLKWIDNVRNNFSTKKVHYHHAKLNMATFNGRICTLYEELPTIAPDLIYLDGPARFSPKGKIRGWTTNFDDGVPMSADILAIEHFLIPGALIVVDGRTANSRFLKSNLQRDWIYCHNENFDQHYFELSEKPLGFYNKNQLNFCLGKPYFNRLEKKINRVL